MLIIRKFPKSIAGCPTGSKVCVLSLNLGFGFFIVSTVSFCLQVAGFE